VWARSAVGRSVVSLGAPLAGVPFAIDYSWLTVSTAQSSRAPQRAERQRHGRGLFARRWSTGATLASSEALDSQAALSQQIDDVAAELQAFSLGSRVVRISRKW
jgi:hypothetical protein